MADSGTRKRKLDCDDIFTRSKGESSDFDWKNCCFICGQKAHEKKKGNVSMVQSGINSNSVMYSTLLQAAKKQNDNEMIARLYSTNGDLVATDARYHRKKSCYAKYIKVLQQTESEAPEEPKAQILMQVLKDKFYTDIESNGKVLELQSLKQSFVEIASDHNQILGDFSNRRFLSILEKHWPELRTVSRGKGKTSLVCSYNIDIDDAVKNVFELNTSLNESIHYNSDDSEPVVECENDNAILHKAAGILRRKLASVKKLEKEYHSSDEVSQDGQKKFVDKTLLKFLGWLKDRKAFTDGSDVECDQKLLAICCDVMSLTTGVASPKHLGLAIHMHHLYGSRKLIDDMYRLGYTVSYTELRHFLTAAAVHMSVEQQKTPSGSLVPSSIKKYEDGNPLLIAAGDNWDHNEATPDGKNTTHAMTSIIVVPRSRRSDDGGRILKIQDRTLSSEQTIGTGGLSAVLHYEKPKARPSPVLSPPPRSELEIKLKEPHTAKLLELKDLMYNCIKLGMFCDDRYEGTWSVFHAKAMPDMLQEKSDVVYNPILLAQPTNYDTVYTTLKRCKEQFSALGQDFCPIVFDMGLLTKAVEILWARSHELRGVIPLDGGMHLLMCVFAGIGYVYSDLGLKALLSDSEVFAPKTADQILTGKDFDRGLRAFLMVDEVLTSRCLLNFRIWCEANGHNIFSDNPSQLDQENATIFLADKVMPLLDEFRAQGREASPTFAFWDDYLQNVSTPFKLYLNASRHAIFDVYEYSRSLFLPFFFASNRTIYARYMPYLVLEMQRLPEIVRQSFNNGHFMTKLTQGQFNSVWIDYCLEVTENKTLKANGGIIGLTRRDGALGRWFLSRPVTAKYSNSFTEADDVDQTRPHHTDNESFRQLYNDGINKMMSLFENTFIDPFSLLDPPCKLVNIATGVSLPAEIEISLLNCHTKGSVNLEAFVKERLVVPDGKMGACRSFFDPIQKVTGIKSVPKAKPRSNDIPINGEEMYIRLLAINSFKKVPLQRVMSFENAPVPLSLFTDDGEMMSGKKADFLHKIEEMVSVKVTDEIEPDHCLIVDGMAVVQMIPPVSPSCSYKDMAMAFWSYTLWKGRKACTIHIVFDRYFDISAKSQTRKRRGEFQSTKRTYKIQADMKIPDWKQALADSSFKTELSKFYSLYMAAFCTDLLCSTQAVIVSGGLGEKVLHITSEAISFVPELIIEQEEADTIMILHARFASLQGSKTICIFSPDTDVLVLLIHHFNCIGAKSVYFQTGRKSVHTNTVRYVPVHCIVSSLTSEQLDIILPLYCISGCDTTSFFFGIGKKSVFKLFMKSSPMYLSISCMGNTPDLTREQITTCTKLVGALYGDPQCKSLNKLRTEKVLKNRHVKPRRLPPTDDSFLLHLQRCVLQLLIWKNALVSSFTRPTLTDYGYFIDNRTGSISPCMMSQAAAAPELLSDVVCTCKDMCNAECACESLQQPCTVACGCRASIDNQQCCRNIYTVLSSNE